MRYMKIQKRGKTKGPARIPQNIRVNKNKRFPIFPPVSAVSMAAITILVNVDINSKNSQTRRNIRLLHSVTAFIGRALR